MYPGFWCVFVMSVVSVISAEPVLTPLVRGCLNCLRRLRDSRHFRESHWVAKHRWLPKDRTYRLRSAQDVLRMLDRWESQNREHGSSTHLPTERPVRLI